MDQLQKLQQDVDKLTRVVNEQTGGGGSQVSMLGAASPIDFLPPPTTVPTPSAANQVRDGDFSFSVNGYHESVAAPGTNKVRECADWFSNDPGIGVVLSFINALTGGVNRTLKHLTHSTYDGSYCDWGLPEGIARFQGLKTVDAVLPGNTVYPNRTMYLGAIVAIRSSQIVIPADFHLYAGLYDNSATVKDWIKGTNQFHLDGRVRGAPAGTAELRYRILARTDRGYEFISDELVLANAPNNSSFNSDVDVYLTWARIDGVLEYVVIRRNVLYGTYDELAHITSGANTYGDNNVVLVAGVGGYPAASDDRVKAYVATLTGALDNIAVDGVALKWTSIFLNIPVAADYNVGLTTAEQVLRMGQSKALDRQLDDVTSVAGTPTLTSPLGAFTAVDTGRLAELRDHDGTVLHAAEAITFVDATHVTFATNVAANHSNVILYIVGGGDHGLLIDMVHISYVSRATYAPYFEDLNRLLLPAATPNGSSQGGIGAGGGGGNPGEGGIGGCVEVSEPVVTLFGNSFVTMLFSAVRRGQPLRSGSHVPNWVNDIAISYTDNLHILRLANGVELRCSPGQVVFRSFADAHGTDVWRLGEGDYVLSCLDGVDECSRIVMNRPTGQRARVGTFVLSPGHRYGAGKLVLSWWKKLLRRLRGKKNQGFIYCHNAKRIDDRLDL